MTMLVGQRISQTPQHPLFWKASSVKIPLGYLLVLTYKAPMLIAIPTPIFSLVFI